MVDHARSTWRVSIRRACRALPVERSTYHYRSRRAGQAQLTERIMEIAATRVRYSYPAHACVAAPRRLAGECQARVPSLSRVEPAIAQQDTQAPSQTEAAGRPATGDAFEGALADRIVLSPHFPDDAFIFSSPIVIQI